MKKLNFWKSDLVECIAEEKSNKILFRTQVTVKRKKKKIQKTRIR